jgi:uncharacterized membrane protein YvlD (DUF360 family)
VSTRGASVARRTRLGLSTLGSWRPSWHWVAGVVRSFITSVLALTIAIQILPGTQVTDGAYSVVSLAAVVLVIGALVRPLIVRLTVLTGVVGLLFFGLLTQALVLGIALAVVPTVEPFGFGQVFFAAWVAALASAVVNWLIDTSSDQVFLGQVLGRAVRATPVAGVDGPGLLVVQLDGLSEPLLRQAITGGSVPTLSRWVRSGTHDLRRWHTGVPATTPAGQAVLLHGNDTAVPGFRWYDKELGRLRVASRPADVAEVEKEFSDGHGLLAYGGASVSNLFSGDAPTKLLTVSRVRLPGSDRGSAAFASMRWGFSRTFLLFVAELFQELYQARRQRIRGVEPRVRRSGTFLLQRGMTTVILRDLNVSIVADQLTHGTPVVYVDFVDYDEVAHHAGPTRAESLRTLENLDRVLALLEQLAGEVGRRYEIAVLSDHGQSQGTTFQQLTGRSLDEVVRSLAQHPDLPVPPVHPDSGQSGHDHDAHADETWVPASVLLAGAGTSGRAVAKTSRWLNRRAARTATARVDTTPGEPGGTLLVAASGSLAHVYRTDLPGRVTREELDELHPRLVRGLAEQPHVGLVVTRRADGAVVIDGGLGWRAWSGASSAPIATGGEGEDPLAAYGPSVLPDLLALDGKDHVGDLVLFGRFDPQLGEVVAFEELVGSHGGVGGWQGNAFLLHPAGWSDVPPGVLTGRQVHTAMVSRLEALGLRS